jgi:signal transduction histidine kinase
MKRSNSLTARVLLLASAWSSIALVVIAVVISTLYRQGVERSFTDLLRAQLHNVVNSVTISPDNSFSGSPQLGDLRYSQPDTGWYWVVEPLGNFTSAPLVSSSLGVANIAVPGILDVPFDNRYERYYNATDEAGNAIQVAETEVVLDGDGRAARFRVTGNLKVVEDDVQAFSNSLYIALAVFGLGSLIVNGVAILFSLKPLDRARHALGNIRNGDAEHLEGDFPREIQPLAVEINALIDSNRRIIERARMQVGNLAHSLKTPIAVLLNEARTMDPQHGELVRSQATAMQAQVQAYLARARIAAQRGTILARTEAEPALERMVRVMRKLTPDKQFDLIFQTPGLVFGMEQHDLEEVIGNLLENAARFANSRVEIRVANGAHPRDASQNEQRFWLTLSVEDDGPGLDDDQISEAMKRGRRLDESQPGTGLGLSIVSGVVSEYHGNLQLGRGALGGLKANLILPGLSKELA